MMLHEGDLIFGVIGGSSLIFSNEKPYKSM